MNFLGVRAGIGACSIHSTGIAVPPGTVHPLGGFTKRRNKKKR